VRKVLDKNIVLFDMDGTLTPARMPIESDVISSLKGLSNYAKIGIVTGSGMDYLTQQCSELWSNDSGLSPEDITLMPCNGTQLYTWDGSSWNKDFSLNIKEHIGEDEYSEMVYAILGAQIFFMKMYSSISVSGNFISYRQSMINWCPIGRDCSYEERDIFCNEDSNNRIRRFLKQTLASRISEDLLSRVKITMGGNTSFDIYPVGWDKSFALSHLDGSTCWFIGDRCFEDGNDRAIYEALLPLNRSFSVDSTQNTIEIVDEIISRIKQRA